MGRERKIEVSCLNCGELLMRRVSRATGTIRCRGCASKIAGEKLRRRVQRTCKACGSSFEARQSEAARGKAKFCSFECSYKESRVPRATYDQMAERLRVERRGAGNPNWQGGTRSRGYHYSKFNVGLKGEDSCRACGRSDVGLHLHHVIPRSMYGDGRHELRNGIPLCPDCHMGWHHRKVTIYRDVFQVEEWGYLISVELLGQEIEAWLDDRYPARDAEQARLVLEAGTIEAARRRVLPSEYR